MSVHVKTREPDATLAQATRLIKDKYQIFHSTVQVESAMQAEKCVNILH